MRKRAPSEAREVLLALFGHRLRLPKARICLWGQPSGRRCAFPISDLDRALEAAHAWMAAADAVYVCATLQDADAPAPGWAHALAVGALWACVRDAPHGHPAGIGADGENLAPGPADAAGTLALFGERLNQTPPHYIVRADRGAYALWCLQEPWLLPGDPDRIEARRLQRDLQELVRDADPEQAGRVEYADDLAWAIRLPRPGEKRIVQTSARAPYALDDIRRLVQAFRASGALTRARLVPPPQEPLQVAELFATTQYSLAGTRTLQRHRGSWWVWKSGAYQEIEEEELRSRLYAWLQPARCLTRNGSWDLFRPNAGKINQVMDGLRAVCLLPASLEPPAWIGPEPPPFPHAPREILVLQNGLLHVPSGRLWEATPRFFATFALPWEYRPDIPAPKRWLAFLHELWEDDDASIATLQEFMGYSLVDDTSHQKMLLIVGPLRSGKGTLGRIWRGLLGEPNVVGPTLSSLGTRFGLEPLIGKPLAIISDARLDFRWSSKEIVERLLGISGEDTQTVDRKFKEPWTGRLPTRIVIMTNELPRLSDASGALAQRFLVLRLTKSWFGKEDPKLTDRLRAELPGILVWAVEGLKRLIDRGHFVQPPSGVDLGRDLLEYSSPVIAFVFDRCELGPGYRVAISTLYEAWQRWCDANGHKRPGSVQTFSASLQAALAGVRVARPRDPAHPGQRPRIFEGIRLRPGAGNEDPGDGGELFHGTASSAQRVDFPPPAPGAGSVTTNPHAPFPGGA